MVRNTPNNHTARPVGRVHSTVFRILRQLVAIAVLPFTVAVVIPIWLARRDGVRLGLGSNLGDRVLQACGVGLLAIGMLLFLASLGRFMGEGRGTLAPWD